MDAVKEFSIFPLEEDIHLSRQSLLTEANVPSIVSLEMPSFIINKPWSTLADEEGIFSAKFLLENADIVKTTSDRRDILQNALDAALGVENSPKIEVNMYIHACVTVALHACML